jgi:hypothetical protein
MEAEALNLLFACYRKPEVATLREARRLARIMQRGLADVV